MWNYYVIIQEICYTPEYTNRPAKVAKGAFQCYYLPYNLHQHHPLFSLHQWCMSPKSSPVQMSPQHKSSHLAFLSECSLKAPRGSSGTTTEKYTLVASIEKSYCKFRIHSIEKINIFLKVTVLWTVENELCWDQSDDSLHSSLSYIFSLFSPHSHN